MAGIQPRHAQEVEVEVRRIFGQGSGHGGEVYVPVVTYKEWYSQAEAAEVFRLAAAKVISEAETAAQIPTPSEVFLLYVRPPSSTPVLFNALLRWFEFWAWPEELRHRPTNAADEYLPPAAHNHWTKTPRRVAESVVAASWRLWADASAWNAARLKLGHLKNPLRLPPVNFRFPNEHSHLREAFWNLIRGESVQLPRLVRGPAGKKHISGEHYRDACGRFFPLGKGEHGTFRELDDAERKEDRIRLVWLNAAYRFGCWAGSVHEHYDVQRADGDVSPPDIYCAHRGVTAHAAKTYVNVFLNDFVRDNDVFKT